MIKNEGFTLCRWPKGTFPWRKCSVKIFHWLIAKRGHIYIWLLFSFGVNVSNVLTEQFLQGNVLYLRHLLIIKVNKKPVSSDRLLYTSKLTNFPLFSVTMRFIIQHTHSQRFVPIICNNINSKSRDIRRHCCEFLDQLLHTWPNGCLERHVTVLGEAIKKGIGK